MLKQFISLSGINAALTYSLLTRGWQVIAGPVSILMIAGFFSIEEQGFYYTFSSVLALQALFELGLAFVIMQFAGHEFATLAWGAGGSVKGEAHAASRFHSVIERSMIWYAVVALVLITVILPLGWLFFSSRPESVVNIRWQVPWVLLVLSAACYVPLIPVIAAIEGSGKVAEVNKLRLQQVIAGNAMTWGAIASGAGLFAAPAVFIVNASLGYVWLIRNYPVLLAETKLAWQSRSTTAFNWMAEIWPMQWRIAVSWISGYIIFQIFTPILFYYHGPESAGKMGMSLIIANMINTFAQAWVQVNSPDMAQAAARKAWRELDGLFSRIFWQSIVVVLLGGTAVLSLLALLEPHPITQRFLAFSDMGYLLGAFAISHVIGMFAHYLRIHKQEPFMLLSVIGAVLVGTGIWYFGKTYGSTGMVLALFTVNLLYGLPSAAWLWAHLRRKWH